MLTEATPLISSDRSDYVHFIADLEIIECVEHNYISKFPQPKPIPKCKWYKPGQSGQIKLKLPPLSKEDELRVSKEVNTRQAQPAESAIKTYTTPAVYKSMDTNRGITPPNNNVTLSSPPGQSVVPKSAPVSLQRTTPTLVLDVPDTKKRLQFQDENDSEPVENQTAPSKSYMQKRRNTLLLDIPETKKRLQFQDDKSDSSEQTEKRTPTPSKSYMMKRRNTMACISDPHLLSPLHVPEAHNTSSTGSFRSSSKQSKEDESFLIPDYTPKTAPILTHYVDIESGAYRPPAEQLQFIKKALGTALPVTPDVIKRIPRSRRGSLTGSETATGRMLRRRNTLANILSVDPKDVDRSRCSSISSIDTADVAAAPKASSKKLARRNTMANIMIGADGGEVNNMSVMFNFLSLGGGNTSCRKSHQPRRYSCTPLEDVQEITA